VLIVLALFWTLTSAQQTCAYQEIVVEAGGTMHGQVVFHGSPPARTFLPVYKNRDICGNQVLDESLLVGPSGEISNVVAVLEGIAAGKSASSTLAVLDNRSCAFVPRVQTVTVGQLLELRNSDPILHDAHARLNFRGTLFNVGLPVWRRVRHQFRDPGLVVVDCNVLHTWMRAYIIVTEHPYATVTDIEGRFTLGHVPAGQYTLHLWHERLGRQTTAVSVTANQAVSLTLVYPPESSSGIPH
jgi:plastocyanin